MPDDDSRHAQIVRVCFGDSRLKEGIETDAPQRGACIDGNGHGKLT
ncbi:MAG: hypothetical protein ACLGI7_12625 [Gammaproteobacteria bacterium]